MDKQQDDAINLIGVISDTHNLLRPEALEALKDVDLIIHAGDVCQPQIIEELKAIAPVKLVRGNNDKGIWAENVPMFEVVKIGAISIYIIHDLKEMNIDPVSEGFKIVISGHSHKPFVREHNEVLHLNPGSAGPRRFKLPVSIARLKLDKKIINAEIVELPI